MHRCFAYFRISVILMGMVVLWPRALSAQAVPVGTRAGIIQAGAGYTSVSPDYSQKRISGITGYGTFDFLFHGSLGIEADAHLTNVNTPQDLSQTSYEIGPRYVYRKGRFEPYAKVMVGIAYLNFLADTYRPPYSQRYGEYAIGAGLDIRLPHHINLRAIDFEQQTWPTFSPNNLTPMLITVGIAYRVR